MARYYEGDIEGKFWFGVQSSSDGEFFGCEECNNTIKYYTDNLPKAEKGVAKCIKALGKNKKKLDKLFKGKNTYNDEMLIAAGFPKERIKKLLMWYARLELGNQIVECLKENAGCSFEAEL